MRNVKLRKFNKNKQQIKQNGDNEVKETKLIKPPLRDDPKAFVDETYEWWLTCTEAGQKRLKEELEKEEALYRNEK